MERPMVRDDSGRGIPAVHSQQRVELLCPWNRWEPGTLYLSMIDTEGRQRVRIRLDIGATVANVMADAEHLRTIT